MIDQAEIHRKVYSSKAEDRQEAARLFGESFAGLQDKSQAWQDIHTLTQDDYGSVRENAAKAFEKNFNQIPDRDCAWEDLHKLTQDNDICVKEAATRAIGINFSQVPNRDRAWQDLYKLAQDECSNVRGHAIIYLEMAFSHVLDKAQAWQDLLRLTQLNPYRRRSSEVLPFHYRYAHDEYGSIRENAARILAMVFNQVPNRDQVLRDLHKLTQDEEDIDVQMYAYYSLGRASIFKATEAEDMDELENELEAAIAYFEESSKKFSDLNPAKFCYPFYRSYLAITFQEAKEDEVQKYLAEAKAAAGSSESKALLLDAVESLARALQESQRLKSRSIEEIASELDAYRWFCDKAANHMAAAERSAPGAVKLMRKCNPLLEESIQATIAEIQKSARQICQTTRDSGTEYEAPGSELQKAAKGLSAGDLISMQRCSSRIINQLKKFCKLLPENEKGQVCEVIEEIGHAADFPGRLQKIELALIYVSPAIGKAIQIEEETKVINKDALARLDNINFQIFRMNIRSSNIAQSLGELKYELKKLNSIKLDMDEMGQSIEDLGVNQRQLVQEFEENMPRILGELEIIARRQQDPRMNEILEELQVMMKSPAETALDRVVTLISIIGFLLQIMPK